MNVEIDKAFGHKHSSLDFTKEGNHMSLEPYEGKLSGMPKALIFKKRNYVLVS